MRERLLSLVWMTSVWVALWGDISVANALGGLLVGSVILVLVPPHSLGSDLTLRPFAALHLVLYFFWELIVASAIVAWGVVTPINRLNQAVVAVPLRTESRVLAALIGNMISLTPGTLTLEVLGSPPVLYIHVLHLRNDDQIQVSVHRLESLALRAFGADVTSQDRLCE